MAGRALALLALHAGDPAGAGEWITEARRRCDRLPDRYVWVSGFVALGHLEIAASQQRCPPAKAGSGSLGAYGRYTDELSA